MINNNKKGNTGFIALMSAVIISVILLLIAVNLSQISFFGRSNILDSELKERSSALAEACADTAILKLANNILYIPSPAFNFVTQTGGEPVTVNSDKCVIVSVDTSGSQKIIKTQAKFNNIYTNLRVKIDTASNFAVQSWEECPTLTTGPCS